MAKYEVLSEDISCKIKEAKLSGAYPSVAFDDSMVTRRYNIKKDAATVWRPSFVHDVDKILHSPYYNRYTDKTQVFSLCKNDDITRRSLHVQLVSRISRTIGSALHLNVDLIESIALGHDIGHPPFAHTGEDYLDELYYNHTGRHFLHNIHSVRVLDGIFPYNVSLQTLDGIACHNGEVECEELHPRELNSFKEFDSIIEKCYLDKEYSNKLVPSTLEGCVVRLSDIIAYLGKDRQDAMRAKMAEESIFSNEDIGSINAEIINNLVVNIIENSYGKDYIKMDAKHFRALNKSRRDNYNLIYNNAAAFSRLGSTIKPMMAEIYGQLLDDLRSGSKASPIFKHHIEYINSIHYRRSTPYEQTEPNQIVVDYIASMTDTYFVELYKHLFPNGAFSVEYKGYFD